MLYSHSRLECYQNCPHKFKLHYLDNVRVEGFETIEAFMGKRVHEALEHLYKVRMLTRVLPLEELIAFYEKEWDKKISVLPQPPKINREGVSIKDYAEKGRQCLTNYYNRFQPFDDKTIEVEKRVRVDLGDNYQLQGIIDRLSEEEPGNYAIHDYKTNSRLPNQPREWVDSNQQLAFYQLGIEQEFNDVETVELVWHFLSFDKDYSSKRSKTDIETLKAETRTLIQEIESACEYPARRNPLCEWCEYKELCPEWAHPLEMASAPKNKYASNTGVQLVNKFQELSNQKQELESEINELKEAIADYSKKNNYGRLAGNDSELIIRFYPRTSFPAKGSPDADRLKEILTERGLYEAYSTLDNYNFTKALNSGAIPSDIAEKIEPFLTKGETTWLKLVDKRE
ncbi:hypothetical protein AUJ15_01460 [Candidatus Micrarchaeota archaeon CG1_02_55_41]|nr:MAG: hypothetical protein AUJ15_01460 [Candidatus Micrarchaeota archaeon CG1_02_55_41]